jgi:hypothetical protein
MVQREALDPSPESHFRITLHRVARRSHAMLRWAYAGVLRPVSAGDVGSTKSAANKPFGRTFTGAGSQSRIRRWAAGAVVQLHNGRLAAV